MTRTQRSVSPRALHVAFASLVAILVLSLACTMESKAPASSSSKGGSGGKGGGGGAGTTSDGGAGGKDSTGGSGGSGGATTNTSSSGGGGSATNSGGSTSSAGGTTGGGAAGGVVGGGGTTSTTSEAAGGSAAGGTTATTPPGTGGAVNLIDEVAKKADATGKNGLDGLLWVDDCAVPETGTSDTCNGFSPCPAGGGNRGFELQLGGSATAGYEIQMRIVGIAEGKVYQGGQRSAGDKDLLDTGFSNDGWYVGGTGRPSLWNVFSIKVTAPAGAPTVYYPNSGINQNFVENHRTFGFDFKASMKVMGQSKVAFNLFDSNCNQIMNCGIPKTYTASCRDHATHPLPAPPLDPPMPGSFKQPYTQGPGNYGQWWYFDVTSVTQLAN